MFILNKKTTKIALIGTIFFLTFLSFFVFSNNKVEAAEYKGTCVETNWWHINTAHQNLSEEECTALGKSNGLKVYWTEKKISSFEATVFGDSTAKFKGDFTCSFTETPMVCLLSPLLWFVRMLVLAAATFLAWILDTDNVALVLTGGGSSAGIIYKMWYFIKDLFNIFFILALLFSAFATIFQVDKYNYKKILLTLVIMALLVNFSYPLARIIIDFSNVIMYSLVHKFFPSEIANNSSLITKAALSNSKLAEILNPKTYTNAGMLLTGVVFGFIFAITLLAFGILLFIRLIALAILIIFSPVGFVGNIIPGLQSMSSKWWDNLFKYAFMGPILMLGLYISIEMMAALSNLGGFEITATGITKGADPNVIGATAFLFIPIVLLWMTMGIAQSMSVMGASAITGRAQKAMGWTAKKFSGASWAGNAFQKYKAERKDRAAILDKTALSSRLGRFAGTKPGEWRDSLQSKGSFGKGDKFYKRLPGTTAAQTRQGEAIKRDIAETRKSWKETGVSEAELQKYLNGKNIAKARAAALEMASNRGFGENRAANYSRSIQVLDKDPISTEIFNDKVKEKNVKLVIDYEINKRGLTGDKQYDVYEEYLGKMGANQLSNQKNLLSDNDFIDGYLKPRTEEDPVFAEEIAKRMSRKDREAWAKAGLIGEKNRNKAGFI